MSTEAKQSILTRMPPELLQQVKSHAAYVPQVMYIEVENCNVMRYYMFTIIGDGSKVQVLRRMGGGTPTNPKILPRQILSNQHDVLTSYLKLRVSYDCDEVTTWFVDECNVNHDAVVVSNMNNASCYYRYGDTGDSLEDTVRLFGNVFS